MQTESPNSLTRLKALAQGTRPGSAFANLWYRWYGYSEPAPISRQGPSLERAIAKDQPFREMSFTFAVIALSGKVAIAGGPLTREKYIAFRDAFPLSGGLCGKIRSLFALACDNPTPLEHYVSQIKYAFPRKMPLYASLVDRLFNIALADGSLVRDEERLLARIAHMLGLSPGEYTDIRARHIVRPDYYVLGVKKKPQTRIVKARYRELMKRYHPDRFGQEELSPEVAQLLQLKISEINASYKRMSKKAAA